MKLLAGALLFLLCALVGEKKAKRLTRRERTLIRLHGLIEEIGDRQLSLLVSFREAALRCPPSPERDELLALAQGTDAEIPLLTAEERAALAAYARSETRSMSELRNQRDVLLRLLCRERDQTREELAHKGQVYRSVGYLLGVAVLLLIL